MVATGGLNGAAQATDPSIMNFAGKFYLIDFINLKRPGWRTSTHSAFCTTEHNKSQQVPQISRKWHVGFPGSQLGIIGIYCQYC